MAIKPETGRCPGCKEHKPIISDFHITRNWNTRETKIVIYSRCRECWKNIVIKGSREIYRRLHTLLNQIKARYGCYICGEKEPSCLQFHHLIGKRESGKRPLGVNTAAMQGILPLQKELAKCTVLCANCHCKVHSGTLSKRRLPKHGIKAELETLAEMKRYYRFREKTL
jgi:hypothetical protein